MVPLRASKEEMCWEGRIASARVSVVVCRCCADSGAEKKDVDENKFKCVSKGAKADQHATKRVPKTTNIEPKGC